MNSISDVVNSGTLSEVLGLIIMSVGLVAFAFILFIRSIR